MIKRLAKDFPELTGQQLGSHNDAGTKQLLKNLSSNILVSRNTVGNQMVAAQTGHNAIMQAVFTQPDGETKVPLTKVASVIGVRPQQARKAAKDGRAAVASNAAATPADGGANARRQVWGKPEARALSSAAVTPEEAESMAKHWETSATFSPYKKDRRSYIFRG